MHYGGRLQTSCSPAQRHNRIDNIIAILLQRLNRLLPRHTRLRHHQINILTLQPAIIHLLVIVIVLLHLLGLLVLFLVAVLVVVLAVVVARVVAGGGALLGGELLRGAGLGLRVQVFDFGFAEDAGVGSVGGGTGGGRCMGDLHPGIAVGRSVDVGLVDDEQELERVSIQSPGDDRNMR